MIIYVYEGRSQGKSRGGEEQKESPQLFRTHVDIFCFTYSSEMWIVTYLRCVVTELLARYVPVFVNLIF